jgi:colanic acid/amylovoran biosynthesis glycosyltransferase
VPRIAYLTGRYPSITPTFVLREVAELRASGLEIDTFSIWRTAPEKLLSPADRAEAERTTSFVPVRPAAASASVLTGLLASPAGVAAMARHALRLAPAGGRGRFLAASWVLESLMLWRATRKRGIRHVHVHLNGTAPAVALLATEFANRVEGEGRTRTWSLTVHGSNEFYDVKGEALPEKIADADFVVCVSDFTRSQLMAFVDEEHWPKIHVVHCGIDPTLYRARNGNSPDPGTPLRLLTVGKLTRGKGIAVLLEATRKLVDAGTEVELTVVGDGPKRGDLESIAARLGLSGCVRFAGAVGQDRIDEYYEEADVFAMSSFHEGVPVVLMEAMAHELPVVAPATMGIVELVSGDNGILVRPARSDQLADALARLADDPALRQRLGTAGRQRVEAEFDIRASGRQLRELFTQLT